ncbi:MAG: hypothetical protein ABW133_04915 [Polyangiaceae bacterium]
MVASIRRHLAIGGKGWSLAAAAVATTLATTAGAADLPAQYCRLSRTPALSATSVERQDDCSRDEDGNRLDDGVENELAKCFVPTVAFDSAENGLASGDPRVVFSARLVGANVIRFRYVFLFTRDTGYVLGTSFPCLKYDHNGDLQIVEVDVTWLERDQEWYGAPLAMYASAVESNIHKVSVSGTGAERLVLSNTHPVIFSTAGKHHWSFRPSAFSYGCNCGPFGRCGQVRESADGLGPTITPATVRHAPGFYFEPENGVYVDAEARLRPQSPLIANTGRFSNTCEYANHGRIVPVSDALSSNGLDDVGFEGEQIYGPCFRGGLGGDCNYTGSVADALAWGTPFGSYANTGKLRTWLHDNAEPTRSGAEVTKFDLHFTGPDSLIPIGLEAFPGLNQLVGKARGDGAQRSWPASPKDGARRPSVP